MSETRKKRVLKPDELCSILKSCQEAGVRELKFADLHVWFQPQAVPESTQAASIYHPEAEISEETTQVIEKESIERDESRIKSDQLDLMLIENPLEYERMLLSGDLVDG